MAKLDDDFKFTGRLGGKSIYKMKGVDQPIIRTKGGPSRKQVKNSPKFELTRRNAAEFGQCAKGSGNIYAILFPLRHVADYNLVAELNKKGKTIQHLDTVGARGTRSVRYSQHRYLLDGFSLNMKHHFDKVVVHPLQAVIDRATGTATVQLPDLLPPVNLVFPWQHPFFRFTICMGAVADRIHNGVEYHEREVLPIYANPAHTGWCSVLQPFTAQQLTIQLHKPEELDDHKTVILAAGIEMGTPVAPGRTEPVKWTGCAKVIAVG